MRYLCKIMFRLNIIVFATVLFIISGCGLLKKKTEKNLGEGEFPGYYEQWLYIKTAGTNKLPDMSAYKWNKISAKRSESSALMHVYEYGPDNVSGRIRALVIDKHNPNRLIAGGASGGIFVSN